jgi:hypothetical protein
MRRSLTTVSDDMTEKFRIFCRASGVWYIEEKATKEQHSLRTRDQAEAKRLVEAKSEAHRQPAINVQIARSPGQRPTITPNAGAGFRSMGSRRKCAFAA